MTREHAPLLLESERSSESGPVECLGRGFPSEESRRSHFLARLRQHLLDPGFREGEGFPLGEVEDILALSDTPYFTVCPNPFLKDVIAHHGRPYGPEEPFHSEPFALNIAAGKGETIYVAHSDYTKADRNRNHPSVRNHAAGARRAQEVWSMAQRKLGGEKTTLGSPTDESVWRRRRWGG